VTKYNLYLATLFGQIKDDLLFSLRHISRFCVCGISYDISIPRENEIQILFKGFDFILFYFIYFIF